MLVQTVCWSPDGRIMIFATDQPTIYSVTMHNTWDKLGADISSNSRAVEVADVTCVELQSEDGDTHMCVGIIELGLNFVYRQTDSVISTGNDLMEL